MKVLSLFDGMACGMLAMRSAGIEVTDYDAYEIDKYAMQVATHNFPEIREHGDVFKADFTQYKGVDFVVGGSPCTYWSIAQTKNRETEAHGIGWELFQQYVRAIREAEPRFFVYENNKSMSDAIRKEISETFGFEPICINSALVSAQNRQRLYWVGVRQEDGTYRKADIDQPDDRGILLKDVLDDGWVTDKDKSHAVIGSIARTTHREYFQKAQGQMVAEPVNVTSDGKTHTLKAQYYKNGIANFVTNGGFGATGVAEPVAVASRTRENDDGSKTKRFEANGPKANCLTTVQTDCMVAEPVGGRIVGRRINEDGHRDDYNEDIEPVQRFEVNKDPQKTNCLTTVQKDNMVAEPIRVGSLPRPNGELSTSQAMLIYSDEGKSVCLKACAGGMGGKTGLYAIPCESLSDEYFKGGFEGNLIGMIENEGSYRNGSQPSQQYRVYSSEGKSVCVDSNPQKHYIVPNENDKQEPIYEVKDGKILIKGKQYPIKLADGQYIIRKLTVDECKRLQTVPDDYDMTCISNTQAYKCLGNGWTIEVIAHLIRGALHGSKKPVQTVLEVSE